METIVLDHEIKHLDITKVRPSNFNPRTSFPVQELEEMGSSVRQKGVIQPILVRPMGDGFQIVYGERRYRASILAEKDTIPSIVRELTDNEAIELAITENLHRQDIPPMEEAMCYKNLMELRTYDVEGISIKFGKSESYIRNRLRLNDLIPPFVELLNNETINITHGMVLAKYSIELQQEIYEGNFQNENHYNTWRKLSPKELSSKIENSYTTQLSNYGFDKKDCENCQFNSRNYSLFGNDTKEGGNCALKSCLLKKNTEHLVTTAIDAVAKDATIVFGKSFSSCEDTVEKLEEMGYEFYTLDQYRDYPTKPELTARDEMDESNPYGEALAEYESDLKEYSEKLQSIEDDVQMGRCAKYLRIGSTAVVMCYTFLKGKTNGSAKEAISPIEELEIKGKRFKEIAKEKTIKDCKDLIDKGGLNGNFTDLEERILYFTMLSALRKENFKKFKIKQKYLLSTEDKMDISKKLTEEQKIIIKRDFLTSHIVREFGSSTELLLALAKQHKPTEFATIEKEHTEVYNKRIQRIKERIALIKVAQNAKAI